MRLPPQSDGQDLLTRKWQEAVFKELRDAPWTMRIASGVFAGGSLLILVWGTIAAIAWFVLGAVNR